MENIHILDGGKMTRQEIFEWVKRRYHTVPDYPWSDDNAVLRHGDSRKWYGLIMEIGRDKLGLDGGRHRGHYELKMRAASHRFAA